MNATTLDEMESRAMGMAYGVGLGIAKMTDDQGRIIECRSRMNRGTSGKAFTTFWYVNGKRIARAKI